MNQLSSESLAQGQGFSVPAPAVARRTLLWAAWILTLLLSELPLVIARELLGTDIPWIAPAWIGIAGLFFAATYAWPVIKPLRRYSLIMGVIAIIKLVNPFVVQSAAWRNLFAGQSPMLSLFGSRVLLVLGTIMVLAVLFLTGVKRQEAFLMVGNVKAPVGGQAGTTRKRGLPWIVFGAAITLLISGGFFFLMAGQNPGWLANLTAVAPWIPLILVSAALNAFHEEAQYRAAPLATLLPAVSPNHAIWLTSIWFGFGHYYGGIPSGLAGFFMTAGLALLMGKAMVETRGFALPWTIHLIMDTIIFFFMVVSM